MRIVQRPIWLVLSQEGQHVVSVLAGLPASESYLFVLNETDALGLWVTIEREDGDHFLLIRWEHMLSIDVKMGERKELGFGQVSLGEQEL